MGGRKRVRKKKQGLHAKLAESRKAHRELQLRLPLIEEYEHAKERAEFYKSQADSFVDRYSDVMKYINTIVDVSKSPRLEPERVKEGILIRMDDYMIEVPHKRIFNDPPVLKQLLYATYAQLVESYKRKLTQVFDEALHLKEIH